jgi:hypothetical protein
MDEESTPEMKMATAFVKSMCIPWKGFGLSCGVGFAPIGAFHKKNSPFTSVSSSLCTMPETEVKRCFMRSLSYWSNKTLESNMSLRRMPCLPWAQRHLKIRRVAL